MKIKTKFCFLGISILVIILELIFAIVYSRYKFEKCAMINDDFDKIHLLMLENRRREKDFFLHFDLKFQDDVHRQTQEIMNVIERLKRENLGPIRFQKLDEIERLIKTYRTSFDEVVGLYFKRGLNEASGLRWELREAIHNIENLMEAHSDEILLNRMLMLRRREKDYLIRKNEKYIEMLEDDYTEFKQELRSSGFSEDSKERIEHLAAIYLTAVKNLADTDKEIEAKTNEFRAVVHKAEPELEELFILEKRTQEKDRKRVGRLVAISTIFTFVLLTLVILFIWRAFAFPLRRLREILVRGSHGDFSARYEIAGEKASEDREEDKSSGEETSEEEKQDNLDILGWHLNKLMNTAEIFCMKVEALSRKDYQSEVMDKSLPDNLEKIVLKVQHALRYPSDETAIDSLALKEPARARLPA